MWCKISICIILILLLYSHICVSIFDPRMLKELLKLREGAATFNPNFDFGQDDEESFRLNYALDPTETKRLALTEEHLVAAFSSILKDISNSNKSDLCFEHLQNYLNDFNQDDKAVNGKGGILRADIVTENPNLALRMIRRIVVTLLNETVNSCKISFPEILQIINDTFTAIELTLPIQQDLNDALMGILIIHFVYGFNATTEIRLGIFNGVKTEAHLYFEDCLALANKAIQLETEALAYQWLVSATIALDETQRKNEYLAKELKDLEISWLNLQKLVKVDNLKDLHNLLQNKTQDLFSQLFNYDWYATCRGETLLPLDFQSRLYCFYQHGWNPYFYINPVKTQILSGRPLIFQFYDFVDDSTIDFIRKSVREYMFRSGTISNQKSESEYSHVRTSMNGWLPDKVGSKEFPKMVKLTEKIEKLTGLVVHKELASLPLQVVMYGSLGGHYDFHTDYLQNSTYTIGDEGDRIATFLIFLSDVKMGGYTAFPMAGIFAKPEKGSAIVWYNIKLNGEGDDMTRHGGCPVILGTKEVANRWIHQYENMFRERCSLDSTK